MNVSIIGLDCCFFFFSELNSKSKMILGLPELSVFLIVILQDNVNHRLVLFHRESAMGLPEVWQLLFKRKLIFEKMKIRVKLSKS